MCFDFRRLPYVDEIDTPEIIREQLLIKRLAYIVFKIKGKKYNMK
jgi:hypothetical protein